MKTFFLILVLFVSSSVSAQVFDNVRVVGDTVRYALVQTTHLDSNGFTDIVAISDSGDLYVYGNDSLSLTENSPWYVGASPKALIVKDFTGDDVPDILVGLDSLLVIYEGSGFLGFSFYESHSFTGTLNEVAYGDVDNDGSSDLVVSSFCDGLMQVFYGPNFSTKIDYPVPISGHNDIEIGKLGSNIVPNHVYFMGGQSTDGAVHEYFINANRNINLVETYTLESSLPYSFCSSITLSDIGGNGILDILGTHGGNAPDSYLVSWEQGSPQGSLVEVPGIPSGIQAADFNGNSGDGNEIFIVHAGQDSVSIIENGTLNTYWAPVPDTPHDEAVSFADMNNDGFIDVIMPAKNKGILITYNNAVDSLLSTEALSSDRFLEIYPNPFQDHFSFNQNVSGVLKLYASNGVCVREQVLLSESKIECFDIQPGVYFVMLDDRFLQKIIKTQ